jgi:hypothetical protein
MTKEYEVQIKTQYHPAESIWIYASSKAEAAKIARRKAKNEGWFDRRNDGYVSFKALD